MPSKNVIILVLIIAIAVFFRFWQFNSIPPGLYQDEAMNGADALKSLETGNFEPFYTNNNGREGMIIWLDALAIKAFGTEPWVLRLFPALAGVLAILGLYFFTKELYGEQIALASSFFMAISFWAVNFSRIGFRAGLMIPLFIWSMYFLSKGIDYKKYFYFIISGILFGLGFYTYIAYRFAPVLILIYFLPYLIKFGNKKLWAGFLIFGITIFIVALPIGLYFLNNPGDFFGRASEISILSQNSPVLAGLINIGKTLGMFNIFGDFNWRHNFAGSPQLFFPVGLLFLLGIILSVKRFEWRDRFLFLWLFIFLMPNFLTVEGNPHALRALGAMPAVMIFAGIGLIWIYQMLRLKKEFFLLLIAFLFFVAAYDFNKYFNLWANNPNVAVAFSQNQVVIADYLNNLPSDVVKYAIWPLNDRPTDNGLPVSAQTVYFLTFRKSNINYVKPDEFDKIKLGKNGTVIIPIYFNLNLIHDLNKQFPNSKIEFIDLNTPILKVP